MIAIVETLAKSSTSQLGIYYDSEKWQKKIYFRIQIKLNEVSNIIYKEIKANNFTSFL